MQRLGLLISAVLFALSGFSYNEFGNLGDVRAKHPEFFKPGVVTVAQLNQKEWYVYCGDAEKCLSEETDDELYEEAQVQAKMNFFNHFAKEDPGVKVEVSGARRLYQCADKEMRFVVMGVPVGNVVVKPSAPTTPVQEKKVAEAVALDTPEAMKQNKAVQSCQTDGGELNGLLPESGAGDKKPEGKLENPKTIAKVECGAPKEQKMPRPSVQAVQEETTDEEKLVILRQRLEVHPEDYRLRMRMARIFARQGRVRRAFNNYRDAAGLLINDGTVANVDKAAELLEIAQYEELAQEYSLALKHYRIALRLGDKEISKKANRRISDLLLRF